MFDNGCKEYPNLRPRPILVTQPVVVQLSASASGGDGGDESVFSASIVWFYNNEVEWC